MKQIAIVSGKGGTGKTTLAASLAFLMKGKVMADCDVDAPNLHILLKPEVKEKFLYKGSKEAEIDQQKCISCGVCKNVCRFDAIKVVDGIYSVDEFGCEGCKACVIACPVKAIKLVNHTSGEYYRSETKQGEMAHARLFIGEETSGGLVGEVRKKAIEIAEEHDLDIVIDGAPGIGCPPISSVTGTNYVVVVAEPTMSGVHDMKRIIQTVSTFKLDIGVIINKYDLNEDVSRDIEEYCVENGLDFLGRVPFDEKVSEATRLAEPVVYYPESSASKAICHIWEILKERLGLK